MWSGRNPRQKWLGLGVVVVLLAGVMLASKWTVGQMSGSGIYLPFISYDYKICSLAPELSNPGNGSTVNSLAPLFEGSAGNDASGRSVYIEISLDDKFEHIVRTLAANVGSGNFSSRSLGNLQPATLYYWRAQLICTRTSSPFSTSQSFTTSAQAALPAPAINLKPQDGASGVSQPVELSWEPVSGALEYLIYYRPSGPHGWYMVSSSNNWLTRSLVKNTAYEWYIVARGTYGYGEASAVAKFTTAQ